jgi:signal transduction histidine kinase
VQAPRLIAAEILENLLEGLGLAERIALSVAQECGFYLGRKHRIKFIAMQLVPLQPRKPHDANSRTTRNAPSRAENGRSLTSVRVGLHNTELLQSEPHKSVAHSLFAASVRRNQDQDESSCALPAGITVLIVKVLIVEDQMSNRKLLRAQLESEDHTVLEAGNGREALDMLGQADVDAIISDILMPTMDGFRLCHEIRRGATAYSDIPLVLYTATFNTVTDRQLAATVGADYYLAKPAATAVILAALKEATQKAARRNLDARPKSDQNLVLEQYNTALVRKLETRNNELDHALVELQAAHEQILELNRTLETRVEQRTAALDAANRELEAFSSSIAHDLRTPLLNISGFADLLRETAAERLNSDGRESLHRIASSATYMGELIAALLEFARLGREPLKPIDLDLEEVFDAALASLRTETEGRNIQWQHARLPRAKGDRILLRQVFVNLIGNAIKYSRACSPAIIEVGWRAGRADEVVIFVRDNGVGFDMQHATTLFGVFKRLTGAEKFEGIGIGLANAHRIVTRLGGRIWAESALGRGATFHFSLLRAGQQ